MSGVPSEENLPLWQRLHAAPIPCDLRGAESRLGDFLATPEGIPLQGLANVPGVRALLLGLADHSSFLWGLATADAGRLRRCLEAPPQISLERCLAGLDNAWGRELTEAAAMRALRLAKQEVALLVALADLGGAFDVIAATEALSRAADAFISAALRFLLHDAARSGWLRLPSDASPERGCGLAVIALGKLGGRELNYSSDVDLAVFFDPECGAIAEKAEPATLFVRITKGLVRLLQQRTADGYVLRADLRLRPDPGSTALAISLPAAYSYYESLGQNWERAAYIKARPVAGDLSLGHAFLANLGPFIWRKYFDYATIADIAAMKRQIHTVHGHGDIAVAGHNVKLGRGGIREIEFFVQTQQLIFGGKKLRLRGSRTLDMLEELGAEGWITRQAVADLRSSYLFLRKIEHRLQMVADEQTHRLPQDHDGLDRFAKFCGYESCGRFCDEVTHCLELVSHHYGLLFEHAPGLDATVGSLVFTGGAADPETLETLSRLGFRNVSVAADIIRGWHYGHRSGVRTAREREVLTELVPPLLHAFSHSGDPDAALAGLDSVLAAMPAAAELLSLLRSNPPICELFGEILGGAPRLARTVISRPHVLDTAIDANVLTAPLDENAFRERARESLQHKTGIEEFLDALRDFTQEELFPLGLRLWSGMIEPSEAACAYSALASIVIEVCLAQVERAFARDHGRVKGGRLAIFGLGKLGSREMTAASDLDLIFIYDFDPSQPESDGPRPLNAVVYYTRFSQRLISALTVPTRRGRLYEVDMRLRPSGRQGPLATQFSSFIDYQIKEAETWEHMAITRARPIAGDAQLASQTSDAIRAVLTRRRDSSLSLEIFAMRELIARAKGDDNPWDLKLAAGGLIDIEFLAQYYLLRHAHAQPSLICPSTLTILETAVRLRLIDAEDARILVSAYRLFTDTTQILRLTLDPGADPRQASEAVKRRLARVAGQPTIAALESYLSDTRVEVRRIFDKVLSSG